MEQSIGIRDYTNDDVTFIIASQLQLYKDEYGFDSEIWKEYLIGGVHQLIEHFNSAKDCLYILDVSGKPAGSIAITSVENDVAQLRFYFIAEEARGFGAGKKLIDKALDFCRQAGYHRAFLWTFNTLYAARHLYAQKGFTLTQTQENNDWGVPILEERWDTILLDTKE